MLWHLRDSLRVSNAHFDNGLLVSGDGSTLVATAGLLAVTNDSAAIGAELIDEREPMIATASAVVQRS
jgi:hypothetical protein